MTTKKNLVNLVLMSIVTVATSFSFTACSDDVETLDNAPAANNGTVENVSKGQLLEPIALLSDSFITASDVMILNADTTKISVSKALADKLGIKSFVDHPMGVSEGEHIRPYHVRATKEILTGDRYILDVVHAGIAEFLDDKPVVLSTEFFKNPNASKTRGASSADLYTDEEGVLHPEGVHIFDCEGYADEKRITRASTDEAPMTYYSAEDVLGTKTRGFTEGHIKTVDKKGTLVSFNSELKRDFDLGSNGDTMNVHIKVPINFQLDYKFYLNVRRHYVVVPYVDKIEAEASGKFAISPQITFGYDRDFKLIDKKVDIYDFKAFSFKFTIGIVPFWVDVRPNLYMQFKATLGGSFYGGFKYEYEKHFKAGFKYNGNTEKYNTYSSTDLKKNEFSFITPQANFEAEATAALMLGASFIIDKLAGPKIAIGPRVKAKAEMNIKPFDTKEPLTFDASLKMGIYADMGVKVKFWELDVAEWNTSFKLTDEKTFWSYTFPQDMENKKNDRVTKVLEKATEAIKAAQDKVKENLIPGNR